jgi:hypothetical protein
VLSTDNLISFYSYGIFKKVKSFVAKNPSVKNARGFAESNFTPWDLASNLYGELRKKAEDAGQTAKVEEYKAEAGKYRAKERFAFGFIDLTTGEPTIVDLSKKQAQGVHGVITKYASKLGKLAFELSKNGSSTSTVVTLSPVIDMDEDLSDAERANFAKHDGKEFDMSLFDGLLYEADETQMTENLVAAGFDIGLIGLSLGASNTQTDEGKFNIDDEDLPF